MAIQRRRKMTKRIAIAKSIEHSANLNIINNGDKMTTQETKRQISMQKMHNARTKRATNNLGNNEKILARYGDMYTRAEINLLHDLHPYLRDMANRPRPVNNDIPNEAKILEILKQLGMYAIYIQEDNHFMA